MDMAASPNLIAIHL
jgi:hypothetical protein